MLKETKNNTSISEGVRSYLLSLIFLMLTLFSGCSRSTEKYSGENWTHSGSDEGQRKYSTLEQINKENVSKLEVAWTYNSGNPAGNVQLNPLIVDGIVYISTPSQEIIALNGGDGTEKWRFNPAREGETFGGINRGLAYWTSATDTCILFTSGGYLNAIKASSGQAYTAFGDKGRVSLNDGLMKPGAEMGITAPGGIAIFNNFVIVGAMTWSSPANVSAFDILTGERAWLFNTIPQPEEVGHETWEDKDFWKEGAGVNVWGGISVDSENGLVFFSTGQPKDDFYRPNNSGDHLYGNSIVALDAKTGERKWHYQSIHHDLWDLDLPCAPILVTLSHKGRKIPGVVQLTKTGNVLLFNRLTGEVLSDIEERPVPGSPLYGENASPTQPYVKWPEPFSKQVVTADDLTNINEKAHAYALQQFKSADAGWFIPPSEKGIIYYGIHGGAEWGGGSYDPEENVLYINSNELAWHITMRNIHADEKEKDSEVLQQHAGQSFYLARGCISCHGGDRKGLGGAPALIDLDKKFSPQEVVNIIKKGKGAMPSFSQIPEDEVQVIASYLMDMEPETALSQEETHKNAYYRAINYLKFLDEEGYPATAPPWGTMNAIDLNKGTIKWKVPLGEHPELTAKGVPLTGTENFGGSIVTAGGLVFIAATRDERFRAFDKDTGEILWETKLPFGGFATPSTYVADGKQYIVIPATGGGKLGTATGDAYVAFSLPDQ